MSYDRNSCLDACIETASFIGHDLCGLLKSPESAKTTASFSKSVVAAHLAGTRPGLHHKLPRPQLLEAAHLHLETADPSPSLVGEHSVLTNVNSFKHHIAPASPALALMLQIHSKPLTREAICLHQVTWRKGSRHGSEDILLRRRMHV